MKAICLGFAVALAATVPTSAADVFVSRPAYRTAPVDPLPLALRTLSKRSAAVLASTPCWRDCTAHCGWNFQACIRVDWPKRCFVLNDACDLTCLKACRLHGGPLVSWTDY
jgi:hypothetical protein